MIKIIIVYIIACLFIPLYHVVYPMYPTNQPSAARPKREEGRKKGKKREVGGTIVSS